MSGRGTTANRAGLVAGCVIAAALVFFLQVVVRDRSVAWGGALAALLVVVFLLGAAKRRS